MVSKANVIGAAGSAKDNKRKRFEDSKGGGNSKKFKGECYVCGKTGHRVNNCYSRSNNENKKKFKGKKKVA